VCGFGEPRWLWPANVPHVENPTPSDDLRALGRLAADWALAGNQGKKRTKPLPVALQIILDRLVAGDEKDRFESADALLESLDRAGASIPGNSSAWERFLKLIRDQIETAKPIRRSA